MLREVFLDRRRRGGVADMVVAVASSGVLMAASRSKYARVMSFSRIGGCHAAHLGHRRGQLHHGIVRRGARAVTGRAARHQPHRRAALFRWC